MQGYFRKAEVEYATSHYTDAYKSYERALELQPDDNVILQAMAKANREQFKDMRGVLVAIVICNNAVIGEYQIFSYLIYCFILNIFNQGG